MSIASQFQFEIGTTPRLGEIFGMSNVGTRSQARGFLHAKIDEVWHSARFTDWDEEGANAVPLEARDRAHLLADLIPFGIEDPDVSADSDGYLVFEWYRGRDRLISFLMGGGSVVYYAALLGDAHPNGKVQFRDRWPKDLIALIQDVLAA